MHGNEGAVWQASRMPGSMTTRGSEGDVKCAILVASSVLSVSVEPGRSVGAAALLIMTLPVVQDICTLSILEALLLNIQRNRQYSGRMVLAISMRASVA
jgi:hypothetical protein